ncbi:DUF4169 family protein [Paracoccus sp. M683]|uniref:DUF4169 family protein n=1 Tax=Paracoccus sp. M683 TaxID=2594268 RepID=UPI0021066A94|nr:DUF4169 family protein [Paracoccus sp. M683]
MLQPPDAGYGAGMTQITNLNRFRKQKARDQARQTGDANAAKFGRSKAETASQKDDQDRAARHLDGHKRDD